MTWADESDRHRHERDSYRVRAKECRKRGRECRRRDPITWMQQMENSRLYEAAATQCHVAYLEARQRARGVA